MQSYFQVFSFINSVHFPDARKPDRKCPSLQKVYIPVEGQSLNEQINRIFWGVSK